jgi:hypothetical protein
MLALGLYPICFLNHMLYKHAFAFGCNEYNLLLLTKITLSVKMMKLKSE